MSLLQQTRSTPSPSGEATRSWRQKLSERFSLQPLWNRELPAHASIRQEVVWPLWLLPLVLFNQIVTPHPIWLILFVTLVGLYGVAIFWVRAQATTVTIERQRLGTTLIAGDELEEAFTLYNHSPLSVLWAEVLDQSTVPNYQVGRVVGSSSNNHYRWNSKVVCHHRGVYRLGPHQLRLGDPFGLFSLTLDFPQSDTVIIYPRVLRLPAVPIPEGSQSGTARRRRPIVGNQPAATVRAHQPTDSLRHVHWPITAHRGQLMVKEMESEPSGTIWVLLNLDRAIQRGTGETGTLEYSVIVAASLIAELLQDDDRRGMGLFTISSQNQTNEEADDQAVLVPPQPGQAQLWNVLAALAPVQASTTSLSDLLRSARSSLGKRATVIVVTPYPTLDMVEPDTHPWLAELVHLQATGVHSSVVFVTDEEQTKSEDAPSILLSRYGIPTQTMLTTTPLPAALTFRRTRRVIRNTPSGGAISIEVEEEVG